MKTSRQLKDKIKNLALAKSANAQILMRSYMMERFLERMALSDYKDRFILKGGVLVTALVGISLRERWIWTLRLWVKRLRFLI